MSQINQFIEALQEIKQHLTAPVKFTDGKEYLCKLINVEQYKNIVQTLTDKTLTKTQFSKIISEILQQNKPAELNFDQLNSIDRIIYTLEAKLQSSSTPNLDYVTDSGETIQVDLQKVKTNLFNVLAEQPEILQPTICKEENFTLVIGVPSLKAEIQANEYIYKNFTTQKEYSFEETQEMIAKAFVVELAKCIKTFEFNEKVLNAEEITFEERLKVVDLLPAKLITSTIRYAENLKNTVEKCLTIDNMYVTIDASLFVVQ
jgi:hypothetical protein